MEAKSKGSHSHSLHLMPYTLWVLVLLHMHVAQVASEMPEPRLHYMHFLFNPNGQNVYHIVPKSRDMDARYHPVLYALDSKDLPGRGAKQQQYGTHTIEPWQGQ